MHRVKVVLDTTSDITSFVNIACSIEEPVYLEDGNGFRANAKSLMGVMYGKFEFKDLWVVSDCATLTTKLMQFIA